MLGVTNSGIMPIRDDRLHRLWLNRNDQLTLTVILTGSPALDSPRIVQDGSLTSGTIALSLRKY